MSDSVRSHRRQPTRLRRPWDSPGKNTGVGCHFLLQCMKVKSENEVAQSCPTLSNPMDCSPPGSSVHGIFQARVLEWGVLCLWQPLNQSCIPVKGRWFMRIYLSPLPIISLFNNIILGAVFPPVLPVLSFQLCLLPLLPWGVQMVLNS